MSRDGHRIFCRLWLCSEPAKARANVLIAHGMGEHSARYRELAQALNDAGFNVLPPTFEVTDVASTHSSSPVIWVGMVGRKHWQISLSWSTG